MSVNSKMTALADEVRTLSGTTDKLSIDGMTLHTHDANGEVGTQEDLIQQIKIALQGKVAPGTSEDLDADLTEQENLIAELLTTLEGKATGGGTPTKTQEKTIDITENGTVEVTPDDGYTLSKVTANVNVASSGGDNLAELLTNKMTALDSNATSVRQYAFRGATALVSVNLPNATSIATNAFYGCTKLTDVNMPLVKSIATDAFNGCSILPSITLPSLTSGGGYMFRYCYLLLTIDLPVITNIVANMFYDCRRLTAVILRSPTMCTLANTSAFGGCNHYHGAQNNTYNPDGLKDGYIYVPSALIEEYKSATNWSTFASQIRAIEDYPEICGVSE